MRFPRRQGSCRPILVPFSKVSGHRTVQWTSASTRAGFSSSSQRESETRRRRQPEQRDWPKWNAGQDSVGYGSELIKSWPIIQRVGRKTEKKRLAERLLRLSKETRWQQVCAEFSDTV